MDSKQIIGHQSQRQEVQIESSSGLPDPLAKEMERLDKLFCVDRERLKSISQRFREELEEGLEADGKNIACLDSSVSQPVYPMNLTWVLGLPTGRERGAFLTLDLGGTNLRVCWISLPGKRGDSEIVQSKYQLPEEMKTGNAEELWDYVAESLQTFMGEHHLEGDADNPFPLGFTFSYPTTQEYVDHGILQTWTKGFDIKGVEGYDVAAQLRKAIARQNLPVRLLALINDTTGAMIASAYTDPKTIIGAIFGTGCNAAYLEDCASIPKVTGLPDDMLMVINCEYGAFDNAHRVLPRTPYDETIDRESPRPGEQAFEKMSAGLYLGEIFRLVLVDLYARGLIFKDQGDISKVQKPYSFDTAFLSAVENDNSPKLSDTKDLFKEHLDTVLTEPELELCRRLAKVIAVRGARLCACGVAAICKKKNISSGHVAADGSVANKHPNFKRRWGEAMGEILDWAEDRKDDPIIMTSAEDGSGFGAAVIAAMTLERAERGTLAGIKGN